LSEIPVVLSFEGEAARLEESTSVAYAKRLASRGWRVTLLSLERGSADVATLAGNLVEAGVAWSLVPRPPAAGGLTCARFVLDGSRRLPRPAVVHARGCLSAAMAALAGVPYVLDLPGFFVDQRIEAGLWRARGPRAGLGRRLERTLLTRARHVIAPSERAAADLAGGHLGVRLDPARVSVIEGAVDLDLYRPDAAVDAVAAGLLADAGRRTLLVAGSPGRLEDRAAVLALARATMALDASFHLLVVRFAGEAGVDLDLQTWRSEATAQGLGAEFVTTAAVSERCLPGLLVGSSAAVVLRQRGFSSRAVSPVLATRALATGKAVVVSPGLGDVSDLVARRGLGVVVGAEPGDTARRAGELLDLLAEEDLYARCRAAAVRHYALSTAVARLEALYRDAS